MAADPAATLAVDRARWEAAGARFEEHDDGIGGVAGMATAAVVLPAGDVAFAVLDYGESTSYLLVAGSYTEHAAAVTVVLAALEAAGIVIPSDVLERLSSPEPNEQPTPTTTELEYKLADLAQEVSELRAQLAGMGVSATAAAYRSASPGVSDAAADLKASRASTVQAEQSGFAWYVVDTYAGHENKVKVSLERRMVSLDQERNVRDVVVPTESDSALEDDQTVAKHTMPGFLLVNMRLNQGSWGLIKGTPGVMRFAGEPIASVLAEVDPPLARNAAMPGHDNATFAIGEPVRVISGPLSDFSGEISALHADGTRVEVLVSIFGHETSVNVRSDQVQRRTE